MTDRDRRSVTVCQFATCRWSSVVLHTYTNVCGVIILERGIFLHFFRLFICAVCGSSRSVHEPSALLTTRYRSGVLDMYALVYENKVFGRDLALRHGTVVCLDPGVSTRKNTSLQTGSRGGRKKLGERETEELWEWSYWSETGEFPCFVRAHGEAVRRLEKQKCLH